ncbi:MAG: hypothetical protein ACTSRI_14410 [Promethearchaeota archaeon]
MVLLRIYLIFLIVPRQHQILEPKKKNYWKEFIFPMTACYKCTISYYRNEDWARTSNDKFLSMNFSRSIE